MCPEVKHVNLLYIENEISSNKKQHLSYLKTGRDGGEAGMFPTWQPIRVSDQTHHHGPHTHSTSHMSTGRRPHAPPLTCQGVQHCPNSIFGRFCGRFRGEIHQSRRRRRLQFTSSPSFLPSCFLFLKPLFASPLLSPPLYLSLRLAWVPFFYCLESPNRSGPARSTLPPSHWFSWCT